jgi:hypothetical protein
MIIIRDNAIWWRRPDGAETQATPEQCATEIERLHEKVEILEAELRVTKRLAEEPSEVTVRRERDEDWK